MNRSKHLILGNGKDITGDVKHCEYNPSTHKYEVTFQNGKVFHYNYLSIEWVREPEIINPANVRIVHNERELFNIQAVSVFRTRETNYLYVRFTNGKEETYNSRDLNISYSCLTESKSQNCMSYLRQLAAINELRSADGDIMLHKQYEKLSFVASDTVMAAYLNPAQHKNRSYPSCDLIFPFGGNASQFNAVNNALCNQISVIQGPPGTGKTQTILNIIANLLVMGKTVQVVSNNNSATLNVLEKLSNARYNLGYLVAPLGNSTNKKEFVQSQTGLYPSLSDWEITAEQQSELKQKIKSNIQDMTSVFTAQERLAVARSELDSLNLEIQYFEQYCSETGLAFTDVKPRRSISSEKIMRLWQECNELSEKERAVSLWFKIKSAFIYGISDWNFYRNSLSMIITLLQSLFYKAKQSELNGEISALENHLAAINAKDKMDELTGCSMSYLRAKLFERYRNKPERIVFSEDDLWKRAGDVVQEYPVVLSTTFSSYNSLKGVTYDYLIMDEASQVDVTTGALALSCARNAVIVGDLKQLPNVIKDDMRKRCDAIFDSYQLPHGYSFSDNSFLKSVCNIIKDVPQTLLREHYRCHPKIIGFCNQKFYSNELIVMTADNGEPDVLTVFKTVIGNHRRDRINQRQIDVTKQEVLPVLGNISSEDIGIIAPYRDQVTALTKQLEDSRVEVDTVHKFQGREKDTILLTTVDDEVTDFSDDPYLLNVAVSRAKKRLSLVVSGNEQPTDSNISDLIAYIEYNSFKIIQSEIYSVFDLLYQHYTEARVAFLKKHSNVSAYNSENLMYGEIVDILESRPNLPLSIICHQPLGMLIKDITLLSDDERRYVMNPATHIDFLIYNRIRKKPVVAIEVDGFHYHKKGTAQHERDRMKDHILEIYRMPLLRFATNGSGERTKIEQFLDEYMKSSRQ